MTALAGARRWRDLMREAVGLWRSMAIERRACRNLAILRLTTDQPNPADAVRWLGRVVIGDEACDALYAHPRSAVTYGLAARPGDVITARCALLPDAWERNAGGVEFKITVAGEGSAVRAERTLVIDPGRRPADRRWASLQVPVPIEDAEDVTVTLATSLPPGAGPGHAWAIWGDPALERRRAAPDANASRLHVIRAAMRFGALAAFRELRRFHAPADGVLSYRRWMAGHAPTEADLERLGREAAALPYRPLISVITPVYNTQPGLLRACIESVRRQVYQNWELCLADDGSTSRETAAVLSEQTDPRIRLTRLAHNSRISAASNAALALATGEFVALLDHDDELTPDALYEVVRYLNRTPSADLVYSDEDKLDPDGQLSEPFFKPSWSPEHLLSANYLCHLTVARRTLVDRVGGFRIGYEGAQDHDLVLRLSEVTSSIHHLPKVLYHWRRTPESTASAGSAKPWADDAGRRALADHVRRNALGAEVQSAGVPGLYRVKYEIRGDPRVTIIIVGNDERRAEAKQCAARIRERTAYAPYEIITVDATPSETADRVNSAVAGSDGAHLVFVDAGLEPADDQWLTALLEHSQQGAIGAVGARIDYADGRLRHIGVVTCTAGGPSYALHGHSSAGYGYFSSAIGVRNYSAVSGECLMTLKALFDSLGGFDPRLPWRGADVDYCLRTAQAGHRIVCTPHARLRVRPGVAAAPPSYAAALAALRQKWGRAMEEDPGYNANLSRESADYRLDD